MWRPLSAALTGWRRIAPDLRGMGHSDAPEGGYDLAAYADDLAGLLDLLRVDRAVVCGLSMGGYVAFELLRRHRARIGALILMSTRATPDDAEGRAKRDAAIARVRRDGPAFLADEWPPKLLAPLSLQTMPEVVQQVRAMAAGSPPVGIAGALWAMRDRPDSTALLPTIDVPTLVLAGRDDQLIPPSAARAMADAIPGAHHAIIPSAGHLPPLEQPVNTGRVVREFLEALP
jgi:pimeloyl-ACP methyl ester carboxylesterase